MKNKLASFAVFLLILALTSCSAPPPAELSQEAARTPFESLASEPSRPLATPSGDAADSSEQPVSQEIRIRLTFGGGEAIAVLVDNPTTQSLLEQLPVTVTVKDFAGAEKIAYFPQSLSREGTPEGYDPVPGDVTCYGPWGNLAIFYGEQPYATGLISMGYIESGLDTLSAQEGDFEVLFQKLDGFRQEET